MRGATLLMICTKHCLILQQLCNKNRHSRRQQETQPPSLPKPHLFDGTSVNWMLESEKESDRKQWEEEPQRKGSQRKKEVTRTRTVVAQWQLPCFVYRRSSASQTAGVKSDISLSQNWSKRKIWDEGGYPGWHTNSDKQDDAIGSLWLNGSHMVGLRNHQQVSSC